MKPKREMLDALEALLFASRRAAGEPVVPDGWRDAVMAEVRRVAVPVSTGNGEALLMRLSWRFAAVAGIAALVIVVHLYLFGVIDYADLAARYIENPIDFLI